MENHIVPSSDSVEDHQFFNSSIENKSKTSIDKQKQSQYMKDYRARKKKEKVEAGLMNPKTSKSCAQRAKEYRDRKKMVSDGSDSNELRRQKNKERQQRFRDRSYQQKDLSLLDTILSKKDLEVSHTEKKRKVYANVQNTTQEQTTATCDFTPTHHSAPSINTQNSFHAPYEQHPNCAIHDVLLQQFNGIPGDGNCLFNSLIKLLDLKISPLDLRKKNIP